MKMNLLYVGYLQIKSICLNICSMLLSLLQTSLKDGEIARNFTEIIYFSDLTVEGIESLNDFNKLERTMYMLLKTDKQINPEYLNHLLRILTDDSSPSK